MRLFSRIFSIILVLFVLSILYLPSVKAGCSFDAYGNCTGTCSCSPYCGSCNCKAFSTSFCIEDKSTCYTCPTNTPKPTSTPQPTRPGASPTLTPAGGCWCQNGKCVGNLTKCTYTAVGCPQTCSDPAKNATIKEYCTTTNQTCGIKPCAGYSASCVSNCNCLP